MSTPAEELVRVTDESAAAPTLAESLSTAFAPQPEPAPVAEPAATVETPAPEAATLAEPVAPVVEPEAVIPPPESHFAPLFELAQQPLKEALPKAVEWVKQFATVDAPAEELLFRSVYVANRPQIHEIALREMGVPAEKVQEFIKWAGSGAPSLAAPAPQQAAFPDFPQPDVDGFVVIGGVQYDTNIEGQKLAAHEAYDDKKFIYDTKIEKQQTAAREAQEQAEAAQRTQHEQQTQAQQEIQGRFQSFHDGCLDFIETTLDGIDLGYGAGDEWKEARLVRDILGEIDADEKIAALAKQAGPHIRANDARAEDYKKLMQAGMKRIILSAVDRDSRDRLRANKTELALSASQPVLPPGTQTIPVTQTLPDQRPKAANADQARQNGLAAVGAALDQRFGN